MNRILIVLLITAFAAPAQNAGFLDGKVPTEYSGGHLVRAQTVKQLLENVEFFYEKQYPQYKFAAGLKVPDSLAWSKLGYPMPYGMPHYNPRNGIVIAAKKNLIFPDASADHEISPYDAIAVHELGHYFMSELVRTDIYPNWANEFIATYFQVLYADYAKLKVSIQNDHVPKHRSLEDFEKGFRVVGDDYGWYQGQFMVLADRLHARHKRKILDAFIENYRPGGKNTDALLLLRSIDKKIVDEWLMEMK